MNDLHPRYLGLVRLFGTEGLAKLQATRACVVGIGGVGSWAVEALARSGLGALTLIDLDDICASNLNRQIHALESTVGQSKVAVMAERCAQINPELRLTAVQQFYTAENGERLLREFAGGAAPGLAWVLDCLDDVTNKCHLLARCRSLHLPVVSCGAAGARTNASALRVADLAEASHDKLLSEVRRRLRREHGFPREGQPMGLVSVFSRERPVFPQPDGTVGPERPTQDGAKLSCDCGLGSAVFVTGAFGFQAAGWVVRQIVATAPPVV